MICDNDLLIGFAGRIRKIMRYEDKMFTKKYAKKYAVKIIWMHLSALTVLSLSTTNYFSFKNRWINQSEKQN
jgi:hypothetical protein